MHHVMIDLETMGTENNAAIIAIGAVMFDPKNQALGSEFYIVIDLRSAVDLGLKMSPDTVLWWMAQSQEARDEFKRKGHDIREALVNFSAWLRDNVEEGKTPTVWGNGAAFDPVLLETAYKLACLPVPWSYHRVRCYRTTKSLAPEIKLVRSGTHHNAVDDARDQAIHLVAILGAISSEEEARTPQPQASILDGT